MVKFFFFGGGMGDASNSEHPPDFRTSCEGEGRSAQVHGRGTLRTSPWTQNNCMEGDKVRQGQTSRLLDQIGPVGRFGEEKKKNILNVNSKSPHQKLRNSPMILMVLFMFS